MCSCPSLSNNIWFQDHGSKSLIEYIRWLSEALPLDHPLMGYNFGASRVRDVGVSVDGAHATVITRKEICHSGLGLT